MRPFLLMLAVLLFFSCSKKAEIVTEKDFIKGVYGHPAALLDKGYRFDSLGINAVFVRSISLNLDFYKTAKEQGAAVYVEFPTLNGKGYVEAHPDAWPIDKKGLPAPPADWFMGVCPIHPGFREFRSQQLREILKEYAVDGIFLDYVHWHAQFETKDPILPETCFCERCTSSFGKEIKQEIPGESIAEKAHWILRHEDKAWRKWRADILNGWVEDMGKIVKSEQPQAKLGVFYCSWYPSDYDSALYKTLGIDPLALAQRADVLSPMLFHRMKDRPTSWVGEYVTWLGESIGFKSEGSKSSDLDQFPSTLIWPIVQAHNNPGTVSPEEFHRVLMEGSKSPSSGIMMFSAESIAQEPAKIKVLKQFYRNKNSKD
ncbi:family 10 glycosylhydrolase [Cecembia calidifontis]|uniref:Glycosyl hydrolase family 10 n=1 Tax=Cecembia calidifontis TaxID=1187080 RepID=A0A4Q7P814_9BACT|nr:family 10 glycosylhydrolase [Cecembia calidifontis]RZS96293.1 glycosyl hydrolase family 10 [Cecembia calidifontis]